MERIDLGNNIRINLIKSNKFKSNYLSCYFIRPLRRKEVTLNALLPLVLKRGSKNYKTSLDIDRRLEELYGARFGIGISKKGEKQIIRYSMEWIKSRYIDDDINDDVLSLLFDIVYNPLTENHLFIDSYLEQEKINLKKLIKSKINNKRSYAIERCIKGMCKNERYELSGLGILEDIENISNKDLYNHYNEIIMESPIEIFFIGEYDNDLVKKLKEVNLKERSELVDIPDDIIISNVQTKNMIRESFNVSQGKLVIGYRSGIKVVDDLYYPLLVANSIFGGGANSKLFKSVRERESLAYYIGSSLIKEKSIILVDAGINFGDFDKTIEIINEELNMLKNGHFTEEDIRIAKKGIIKDIDSISDSFYLTAEYYLDKIMSNRNSDKNYIKEKIMNVQSDEIIKAINTLSIDTIYFMEGKRGEI